MKYCLNYFNDSKIINKVEEIAIRYEKNDRELPAFIEQHLDKRIIVCIPDIANFTLKDLDLICAIKDKYDKLDLAIALGWAYSQPQPLPGNPQLVEALNNSGTPWFIRHLLSTWEQLHYYLELGVSEVYLVEEICFEIASVAQVCKGYGAAIRLIPNVAQSFANRTPDSKSFFIRPEDIDLYEPYISTIEFWGDLSRQDTFYKIYHDDKEWYGDLREIIAGLNISFDSHRVLPIFGNARLNCAKRCIKGSKCRICESAFNISKILKEKGAIIKNENKSPKLLPFSNVIKDPESRRRGR